ncbi:hypothetical protein FHS70_000702 [Flammeovirga yaeyamensis]|nr:hypothetical protein [Flammeovirga yaeyamensis]
MCLLIIETSNYLSAEYMYGVVTFYIKTVFDAQKL